MKPLKLSMTAFGPYKNRETIDFTKLEDHHLFVISGATGAGKTTIFDGICFALYGTASGSDRENISMLRSHFADDDTHTSVELIFELNGRTYRVFRQLGHVKKGNKTPTGERYEFFEQKNDQTEVPCVDRQIVSEINKKLEAIIGLTQDQFKQIVMLPQGEFRKLLTSETENKEAILRRLFKTERYKHMNLLLKEKKEDLNTKYLQETKMLDHHIQSIHTALEKREDSLLFYFLNNDNVNVEQIIQGLEEEIHYLSIKIDTDDKNYREALQKYEQKQAFLHKAKTTNDRFILLDQKNEELTTLQNQRVIFLRKEKQVDAAERASRIEPYEKQLAERRKERDEKERYVNKATTLLTEAKRQLELVQQAYSREEQKEAEREKLKRNLENYYELLPTIEEMDQIRRDLKKLSVEIEQRSSELKRVISFLDTKEKEVEKLKRDITEKESLVSENGKKHEEMYQLREQYIVLNDYMKNRKSHRNLQKELEAKEKEYLRAEKTFKELETIWFHNQAAVLASHLTNGDHCPVCGSTAHPHKAAFEGEQISKEQFDHMKAEWEEKQKAYQEILATYRSSTEQLKEKAQAVSAYKVALEHVGNVLKEVRDRGVQLKNELAELKKAEEQLAEDRKYVSKLETDIKKAREKKEEVEGKLVESRTSFTQLDATSKERCRNIPEELQDLTALKEQIKVTETEKLKLEKRWEEVQEQLKQADKANTEAQLNLVHGKNQFEEVQTTVHKVEEMFQQYLHEASFENEEMYKQAKMKTEDLEGLKKEIETYKQRLATVQKQIEDLTEELKEKDRVDVKQIEEQLQQLKRSYEAALEQLNRTKKYKETANTLKDTILNVKAKSETLEKELRTVTDLYDVLRGQNDRKISFERYLQIDYLEQITNAANERFKTLTNGQFYLIRSDRQEARGKQSGLSIDVYDSYTGQTRDVKTLSGGEKFIASLCLALGMSDVIQSFQGSISMDTMFIDEGFGSLDEESLHKSIDALISLQETGRTIGVISHVEELKTIFPAMLEVNKTKEGYSETRFVLK